MKKSTASKKHYTAHHQCEVHSVIPNTYFHAENFLVEARRDLKCTHQVHRKRIYESAYICNLPTIPQCHWSDPLAVIQVSSNISASFKTVGLNVRPFCTNFIQSEKISTSGQLFSLANPRSASIETGQ